MPYEVRNYVQDGRSDLYRYDELPHAIKMISSEILTKAELGLHDRGAQSLCATLGQLFNLLGRHDDAAFCYMVALSQRDKPSWRTYEAFGPRMLAYASRGDSLPGVRRRDQLLEAEHDLFLFSLVRELTKTDRDPEAIVELRRVRNIRTAPNGLYVESEVGHTIRQNSHRVADARNLLVSVYLDRGSLSEIQEMKQEYDLADSIGTNGHLKTLSPEQAAQCFKTTERVAALCYQREQFEDARRMYKRLSDISLSATVNKSGNSLLSHIPKSNDHQRYLRQCHALCLSRSTSRRQIEEALQIQSGLLDTSAEVQTRRLFTLRLNNAFAMAAYGDVGAASLQITAILEHDESWARQKRLFWPRVDFTDYSGLWLHEIPLVLLTLNVVHQTILTTCASLAEDTTYKLLVMTTVCARPTASPDLSSSEGLVNLLRAAFEKGECSLQYRLLVADQLVGLLCCLALEWEQRSRIDTAYNVMKDVRHMLSTTPHGLEPLGRVDMMQHMIACTKVRSLVNSAGIGRADVEWMRKAEIELGWSQWSTAARANDRISALQAADFLTAGTSWSRTDEMLRRPMHYSGKHPWGMMLVVWQPTLAVHNSGSPVYCAASSP